MKKFITIKGNKLNVFAVDHIISYEIKKSSNVIFCIKIVKDTKPEVFTIEYDNKEERDNDYKALSAELDSVNEYYSNVSKSEVK